jgi:exopolysaccharide biosynthesis polyprenyl glycosylphosphotransferase
MRHTGDAATPRLDDLRTARPATLASATMPTRHRRGWYARRALALADVTGLSIAFVVSSAAFADRTPVGDNIGLRGEVVLFLATLPLWVVLAKTLGLYERDDARADHSTADETFGVINLVTLGTWMVFVIGWATGTANPELDRAIGFWALALALVSVGRIAARAMVRRLPVYSQRAIVVGAGHVGQLAARKIQQHPEYGIDLVGFVDEHPRDRRPEIADLPVLGGVEDLDDLVTTREVERVIVAFSREPDDRTMALVRSLRDQNVIVDLVPRLFELVGPRADIHLIEGLPLLTVPPARLSRSSLLLKRVVDVVGATTMLVMTSPIFLVAAIRIRMESPGPVFFRQTRLGANRKPFTVLKFRTMKVDTDEAEHRAYIQSTMSAAATMDASGTYKLSRENAVTPFGRLLRKTSLDELPQLINVLRGDMSLVGPRPCIPYETEFFEPHHFDRFLVPQGITGLWQVTARAKSTFGEALEMDVAYVRGWTIGLDLRLLLRTPFALLRQRKATR